MLYPVHIEKFRGDVRRKSFLGLINVKNIEGNLKNVKNVFRQNLITTGMCVRWKLIWKTSNMSKSVLGTLQPLYNSSSFRTLHSDIQNDVRWNTFALKFFYAHGHYYFVQTIYCSSNVYFQRGTGHIIVPMY